MKSLHSFFFDDPSLKLTCRQTLLRTRATQVNTPALPSCRGLRVRDVRAAPCGGPGRECQQREGHQGRSLQKLTLGGDWPHKGDRGGSSPGCGGACRREQADGGRSWRHRPAPRALASPPPLTRAPRGAAGSEAAGAEGESLRIPRGPGPVACVCVCVDACVHAPTHTYVTRDRLA